jgi:hypothetical protein
VLLLVTIVSAVLGCSAPAPAPQTNGFPEDPDSAIYRYNHTDEYVTAVRQYAAILAADPAAFTGYYRWNVYYNTTSGDVLLPVGYTQTTPVAVDDYLASHPQ